MKKDKGFTFIEVLIVIAITAILSSIIFASVNSVRTKSDETRIKSNLGFVRSGATTYFNRYNNYGTATVASDASLSACSTANTIFGPSAISSVNSYIIEAELASDVSSNWVAVCALGKSTSDTNASSFAVAVPLKTQNIVSSNSGIDYYCVDSIGNASVYDTASLGGGANATAKCSN